MAKGMWIAESWRKLTENDSGRWHHQITIPNTTVLYVATMKGIED